MLKIFVVQRTDIAHRDETAGVVVIASNSVVARQAAASRAGDEGRLIWFTEDVTVLEIGLCTDELLMDGTIALTG